jgi:glycogen operon protein
MPLVCPGDPYPLGAIWDGVGTNVSVFSSIAEKVELCLFGADGTEDRLELPEIDGFCWHGYIEGMGPGQRYGFRVHGPYDPSRGLRCNPNKVLLDPYAKAVDGDVEWHPSVYPYELGQDDTVPNDEDSAQYGRTTVPPGPRGTRRSSTRRMSRASPRPIPAFPLSSRAPTPAWLTRSWSTTSRHLASPPWS